MLSPKFSDRKQILATNVMTSIQCSNCGTETVREGYLYAQDILYPKVSAFFPHCDIVF